MRVIVCVIFWPTAINEPSTVRTWTLSLKTKLTIVQITVHVRISKRYGRSYHIVYTGADNCGLCFAHQQSEAGNQKQSSKTLYWSLHVQLMNMRFILNIKYGGYAQIWPSALTSMHCTYEEDEINNVLFITITCIYDLQYINKPIIYQLSSTL